MTTEKFNNYKTVRNYLGDLTKTNILLQRGVVIKINDYTEGGIDFHNHWGVILSQFKDNGDYRVHVENCKGMINILHLPISNIKCVIGSVSMDCVDIGAERHKTEVIPLINKALRLDKR